MFNTEWGDLIKKATSLKKENIQEAIQLIERAIEICPEKILDHYYKLSSYYHISGNKEKSYFILEKLLEELDEKDYFVFSKTSEIYHKKAVLLYKDKQYKSYIRSFTISSVYNIIHSSIIGYGRKDLLDIDKFYAINSPKFKNCFPKIKSDLYVPFKDKILSYLSRISESLLKISELSNKYGGNILDRYPEGLAVIDEKRMKVYIRDKKEFQYILESLKQDNFIDYFDKIIKPLFLNEE